MRTWELVIRMYDRHGIKLSPYATRIWGQVPRVGDRIMLRVPDDAGTPEFYEAKILKVIWGLGVHGVDENAVTLDCKWVSFTEWESTQPEKEG